MSFDPFLYVAFGIGFVAGRFVRLPGPWVGRATLGTVFVLVGLLGASLSDVPLIALATTLPVALLFVGLVLGLTAGVFLLLSRGSPASPGTAPRPGPSERFPVSFALLAALVVGFALGRAVDLPFAAGIPWALYLLLALVAFGLHLDLRTVRRAWVPIASAAVGAIGAALVVTALLGTELPASLATALAFGWYTLAGPLVAERAGPALGLLAFLTNFLREDLTMILSPSLGRKLRGEGLTALGGATSMDTTLYFVTRYGDEGAGGLALASGLVLTVAASLLLPAVLAL
ncbi:MAG: lysine exporter LysO family protein [Thermoplasmata archaeon]